MQELLTKLGNELVNSPFLSLMILDRDSRIVWHNQRFAQDFYLGDDLVGKKCYNVTGSAKEHPGCPLQASLNEGKRIKGYLDFGSSNFFYLTIPLDESHAAKLHIFLPKEPDNQRQTD